MAEMGLERGLAGRGLVEMVRRALVAYGKDSLVENEACCMEDRTGLVGSLRV